MRLAAVTVLLLGGIGLGVAACSSTDDEQVVPADERLEELLAVDLGGDGSSSTATRNAFSLPDRALPGEARSQFEVGDSFFTQKWVTAPASTDSRDGLGPTFNAEACASCHERDGRGTPPTAEDPDAPGLLFRLSVPGATAEGAPVPEPVLGGQLQDHAIRGVPAEATMGITEEAVTGTFDDGTPYTLVRPTYALEQPAFAGVSPDLMISPRLAPAVIGMGLLEAVPEEDVEAAADPDDADGDGISGRVNRVWNPVSGRTELGRFGWKANVADVENQTAGAFHGDIGITSRVAPDQDCPPVQTACAAAIDGGSPEVDDQTLDAVVFYTRTLAVPKRRVAEDAAERADQEAGAEEFLAAGCAACHSPILRTGDSDLEELSDRTIHPYTDLLLHDMGPGLADGRPDFLASGSEWRTPPLWGIGLTGVVNGNERYLHDGRARTLAEAILWHGGEAESSKAAFLDMDAGQRADLIAFLESL